MPKPAAAAPNLPVDRPAREGAMCLNALAVRSTWMASGGRREKIESRSRPDRGTVKIESRISNQRGEVVMSLVSLVIYLRR